MSEWAQRIFQILVKDVVTHYRILRLKACLYGRIPWADTYYLIKRLQKEGRICRAFRQKFKSWLTLPNNLNQSRNLKNRYRSLFQQKEEVYRRWTSAKMIAGAHAEDLLEKTFAEEGYAVAKRIRFVYNGQEIEIDLFCVKADLSLVIEVKNIASDVIMNPAFLKKPSKLHKEIEGKFRFSSERRLTPILIASFVDRSFYAFDTAHQGLHCQTYLQLFPLEKESLVREVKQILGFGNIRATNQTPNHVKKWITRIPQRLERYKIN